MELALEQAARLAEKYGLAQIGIIALAIWAWPLAKQAGNAIHSVVNSWIEERKILISEVENARLEMAKIAGNHIVHLQESLERVATTISENQREMGRCLEELGKAQVQTTANLEHMNETMRDGFAAVRDILQIRRD